MDRETIPRLPVFGWQALRGGPTAMPCMLTLPRLQYTTSGRASILLALEALGVGTGQGVLLPTYHCPTMVAPVTHLGATPVFYPIDEHGTPQFDWLDRQHLAGVRVLLAAHYFGLPQAMGRLRRWCDAQGIALIEDCAHALFGQAGERPVGAWGDVAIGSLTKFLPMPEGGCLVLNTQATLPRLNATAATTHLKAAVDVLEVGAAQGQLFGFNTLVGGGLNSLRRLRGSAPQHSAPEPAASGTEATGAELLMVAGLAHRRLAHPCQWLAQTLPRGRVVQRRRRNYEHLLHELGGHAGLHPLAPELPPDCAPYVFPLWVDTPDPGYAELRRLGMPVFRWDRLWPKLPALPNDHGRLWSHHVIQLACHQDLSADDLTRFLGHLLRLYERRGGPEASPLAPAPVSVTLPASLPAPVPVPVPDTMKTTP